MPIALGVKQAQNRKISPVFSTSLKHEGADDHDYTGPASYQKRDKPLPRDNPEESPKTSPVWEDPPEKGGMSQNSRDTNQAFPPFQPRNHKARTATTHTVAPKELSPTGTHHHTYLDWLPVRVLTFQRPGRARVSQRRAIPHMKSATWRMFGHS